MQKKDDKVGNKTAYEEERLVRMREKKSFLIMLDQLEIMPFFLRNSFLAILMLISQKLVQRRRIGDKCGVFATRRPSPN